MKPKALIYLALATDLLIAATKFIVAAISHSSAMLSEGVHSVIDSISQVLLLWGVAVSKKEPDERRPFGYGRELYFWSFVVSLMIFSLGGCISLYEGIIRLKMPAAAITSYWNYIVLGISFAFTAVSAFASLKTFNKQRGNTPFLQAVVGSRDPSVFIVMLGDIGDLVCLVVAFFGVLLTHIYGNSFYDAVASIIIGIVLILISLLLVRESRSLLMGETVRKSTVKQIIAITEADAAIVKVKKQFTVYLSPEEVILQLTAIFEKNLTTEQITTAISNVTKSIQEKFPTIKQIFIEPVDGTR